MEERYCDDPHCRRVDPLAPGDELAVHPKAAPAVLDNTFNTAMRGEQIWSIHKGCFSPSRHVRA